MPLDASCELVSYGAFFVFLEATCQKLEYNVFTVHFVHICWSIDL